MSIIMMLRGCQRTLLTLPYHAQVYLHMRSLRVTVMHTQVTNTTTWTCQLRNDCLHFMNFFVMMLLLLTRMTPYRLMCHGSPRL